MSQLIYECKIPQEISDYIQILDYEKKAREDLVITIITAGIDPQSENAKFYFEEYIQYTIKLNIAKMELQTMYIPNDIAREDVNWLLVYENQTLEVRSKQGVCTKGVCMI